jgi:hypothetical protein
MVHSTFWHTDDHQEIDPNASMQSMLEGQDGSGVGGALMQELAFSIPVRTPG